MHLEQVQYHLAQQRSRICWCIGLAHLGAYLAPVLFSMFPLYEWDANSNAIRSINSACLDEVGTPSHEDCSFYNGKIGAFWCDVVVCLTEMRFDDIINIVATTESNHQVYCVCFNIATLQNLSDACKIPLSTGL